MKKKYIFTAGLNIIAVFLGLVFIIPLLFLLMNSFKSFQEIMISTAAFPQKFLIGNYATAWKAVSFPRVFLNSLIITVAGTGGIILCSATAAYWIARYGRRPARIIFYIFVAAMIIPIQSIMIPLVKVTSNLNIMNTRFGLIMCYWGFGTSMALFLINGFIKSIPREIEEAAIVDGAGIISTFVFIVLPLLKTILVTVAILQSLWIWNDFLLPVLMLSKAQFATIPVAINMLFDQHTRQWDLALPALVLSCIPIVIFFLAMQKQIIKGIVAGAVKG